MAERSVERFYLPELDTLRFFAFLSVFSGHVLLDFGEVINQVVSLPPRLLRSITGMGGYGVDLFFALSAYLLTRLLLRERIDAGRINVRSFYIRRILRIWPLFLFHRAGGGSRAIQSGFQAATRLLAHAVGVPGKLLRWRSAVPARELVAAVECFG